MNAWSLPMYSHLRFTIFKSDLYHIIDLAPACTYRSITNIYAAATIWNKQAISIQNRTGWVRSPQEFVASPSCTLNSSWKKYQASEAKFRLDLEDASHRDRSQASHRARDITLALSHAPWTLCSVLLDLIAALLHPSKTQQFGSINNLFSIQSAVLL